MTPDHARPISPVQSELPWITLEAVTVRLRQRWYLHDTSWQIRTGEQWAIVGANGSGKTTLAKTLRGEMPVVAGQVIRHYEAEGSPPWNGTSIAYVAPEQTRQLVADARWQDRLVEFSAGSGHCRERRVTDLLEIAAPSERRVAGRELKRLAERTGISHLLDTPVRALSSGETARVLFARALIQRPRLLILDEPFNGLDTRARADLAALVSGEVANGLKIVLITHRPSELLPAITHLALLDEGRIVAQGIRKKIVPLWRPDAEKASSASRQTASPVGEATAKALGSPIVDLRSVSVQYGEKKILDRVSWRMYAGQHWAIAGPNGAGKTTLLALISGDHLQAYANDIHLFGRRRGSGESIWDIKKQIGLVTPHFHAGYQKRLTALEVVCSGFFDSVGLYRRCSRAQKEKARMELNRQDMAQLADNSFDRLSHGQQRLVLIARAMVKRPTLLVLDEPCAGLDTDHRLWVLTQLDAIAARGRSQLLYVTHHADERPACITHTLNLAAGRVVSMLKMSA